MQFCDGVLAGTFRNADVGDLVMYRLFTLQRKRTKKALKLTEIQLSSALLVKNILSKGF